MLPFEHVAVALSLCALTRRGVVDLVFGKAYVFEGPKGDKVAEVAVPPELAGEVEARRGELVERVSEVDDEVGWCLDFPDLFLRLFAAACGLACGVDDKMGCGLVRCWCACAGVVLAGLSNTRASS